MADPTTVREWLEKAIQMAYQLDTDPPMLSSWSWFAENAQKALDDSERSKDAEMTRIAEMAEEFEQTEEAEHTILRAKTRDALEVLAKKADESQEDVNVMNYSDVIDALLSLSEVDDARHHEGESDVVLEEIVRIAKQN